MSHIRNFLIALLLLLGLVAPTQAFDRSNYQTVAALSAVPLVSLPVEARDTLRLIKQNGPFPYPRDGVVFGNRERILPSQARGYYREYTVKTPGISHRGARRIVSGRVGEYYYTADHYQSFQRIKE